MTAGQYSAPVRWPPDLSPPSRRRARQPGRTRSPPRLGGPRGGPADPLPARRLPAGLHRRRRLDVGRTSSSRTSPCSSSAIAAALAAGLTTRFRAASVAGWPVWIAAGAASRLDRRRERSTPAVLGRPVRGRRRTLVTAAKFAEYALLAPAVPLLVRGARDLRSSSLRSLVRLERARDRGRPGVQILGVDIFDAWAAGRRQPSFLGHHDFAALSGASLSSALIGRARRRARARDGVAGGLGPSSLVGGRRRG